MFNKGNLPTWMSQQQGQDGFEDVNPQSRNYSYYKLAQGISPVVAEGLVNVGSFYETDEKVSLGRTRKILVFKKRVSRKLLGDQGKFIACRGYELANGGKAFVYLKNASKFSERMLAEFKVPALDNADGRLERSCKNCSLKEWTEDATKKIAPPCSVVHEVFFVDITESTEPKVRLIEVAEKSAIGKACAKELNNQLLKIKKSGAPIWSAIWELEATPIKNKSGNTLWFPKFTPTEWASEELFELGKMLFDEYEDVQIGALSTSGGDDETTALEAPPDVEEGSAFGVSDNSSKWS